MPVRRAGTAEPKASDRCEQADGGQVRPGIPHQPIMEDMGGFCKQSGKEGDGFCDDS